MHLKTSSQKPIIKDRKISEKKKDKQQFPNKSLVNCPILMLVLKEKNCHSQSTTKRKNKKWYLSFIIEKRKGSRFRFHPQEFPIEYLHIFVKALGIRFGQF